MIRAIRNLVAIALLGTSINCIPNREPAQIKPQEQTIKDTRSVTLIYGVYDKDGKLIGKCPYMKGRVSRDTDLTKLGERTLYALQGLPNGQKYNFLGAKETE